MPPAGTGGCGGGNRKIILEIGSVVGIHGKLHKGDRGLNGIAWVGKRSKCAGGRKDWLLGQGGP